MGQLRHRSFASWPLTSSTPWPLTSSTPCPTILEQTFADFACTSCTFSVSDLAKFWCTLAWIEQYWNDCKQVIILLQLRFTLATKQIMPVGDSRAVQLHHHRAQGRLSRRLRHGLPHRPHPQLHAALRVVEDRTQRGIQPHPKLNARLGQTGIIAQCSFACLMRTSRQPPVRPEGAVNSKAQYIYPC